MSRARFVVYQDIAYDGESRAAACVADDVTLRDALDAVQSTRTNQVDGVECREASDGPRGRVRWFTIYNGMEYLTGAHESRSLHIPNSVSVASSRRIARLAGCKL